jgi:hypothetical protein
VLLGHRADGPKIRAAITAIPQDASTRITYPHATWDEKLRQWVSGAGIPYTAFTSEKGQAIIARLLVRGSATSTARPPKARTSCPLGISPLAPHGWRGQP